MNKDKINIIIVEPQGEGSAAAMAAAMASKDLGSPMIVNPTPIPKDATPTLPVISRPEIFKITEVKREEPILSGKQKRNLRRKKNKNKYKNK